MMWNTEEISSQIKKQIETYTSQMEITDFGTVKEVGDGVARVTGLRHCVAGETQLFLSTLLNTFGMAASLAVGAMLASTVLRIVLPHLPQRHKKT